MNRDRVKEGCAQAMLNAEDESRFGTSRGRVSSLREYANFKSPLGAFALRSIQASQGCISGY
jgi:hypothetical protein